MTTNFATSPICNTTTTRPRRTVRRTVVDNGDRLFSPDVYGRGCSLLDPLVPIDELRSWSDCDPCSPAANRIPPAARDLDANKNLEAYRPAALFRHQGHPRVQTTVEAILLGKRICSRLRLNAKKACCVEAS